jgi:phage protein D
MKMNRNMERREEKMKKKRRGSWKKKLMGAMANQAGAESNATQSKAGFGGGG